MPTGNPIPIPFPLSSYPGENPQEGAGRLVNCFAEPLGQGGKGAISPVVWRRAAGLSVLAYTPNFGYRGGLTVGGLSYEIWVNNASTLDANGNLTVLGTFPGSKPVSIARNQVTPNPDVVSVDVDNGAYVLNTAVLASATATATIGGTTFNASDTVALTFSTSADPLFNSWATNFPVTVIYTLGAAETADTVATGLQNLINAQATLAAAGLTASAVAEVVTITQPGKVGNLTTVSSAKTGTGNETVTFAPATGALAGGAGLSTAPFAGVPLAYNAGGILPQPNSVSYQDGYFFFTIGAGQVYATNLNSLEMNALTFVTIGAKADVSLVRGIPFNGLMFFFTTGSCEIWQDTAQPPPGFPYTRQIVWDIGLLQPSAIAGFETGFGELLWVDQDCGVHHLPSNTLVSQKVSNDDQDRQISQQVRAGAILTAGCYYHAGHKFWVLTSPAWTWEYNIRTRQWNERSSLQPSGVYGAWRALGGHPGFSKNQFFVGDAFDGRIGFIDDQNYTEYGMPQLFRVESGPAAAFPANIRVARADFLFDMGVGLAVANFQMTVHGTAAGANGTVRLTVNDTSLAANDHTVLVAGVTGTAEANGTWRITVVDATHIDLLGSVYVNGYISGGTALDISSSPQAVDPKCAISWSLDGGLNYGNPLIRSLGQQGRAKRSRVSVKNLGISSPMGNRYRLDVTDPVYTGFLLGTCSNDPREVGA